MVRPSCLGTWAGRCTQKEYLKPQIFAGYWFLGAGRSRERQNATEVGGLSPVWVIYEKVSKSVFAHAVPAKGVQELVVKEVIADPDSMGYKSIVFTTDQANPITALIRAVKVARDDDVVIEVALKGDSKANGAAEVAVQLIEGMPRTLKSAMEERIGKRTEDVWSILAWIVEWAGLLLRRYKVGWPDGLRTDQGKETFEVHH